LNKYAERIPPLVELSNKTKVEPGYFLGGGILISALIILITMGGTILSAVITVVYPGFKSIKALETKDTDDDDKIWLTYWCVFGISTLVDEFAFILLSFIPFYFYIKLAFFVWLMAPQTQGATIIYKSVLRPLLLKNKDKIDRIIAEVQGSALSIAKDAAKQA
jgi:receptor expression-enhancing protein 5/6